MMGADSSAWSMRTRTQGALVAPTTSTSTTSMPRSAAMGSRASMICCSMPDFGMLPSRLHTERKRGEKFHPTSYGYSFEYAASLRFCSPRVKRLFTRSPQGESRCTRHRPLRERTARRARNSQLLHERTASPTRNSRLLHEHMALLAKWQTRRKPVTCAY